MNAMRRSRNCQMTVNQITGTPSSISRETCKDFIPMNHALDHKILLLRHIADAQNTVPGLVPEQLALWFRRRLIRGGGGSSSDMKAKQQRDTTGKHTKHTSHAQTHRMHLGPCILAEVSGCEHWYRRILEMQRAWTRCHLRSSGTVKIFQKQLTSLQRLPRLTSLARLRKESRNSFCSVESGTPAATASVASFMLNLANASFRFSRCTVPWILNA